MKYTAFGSLKDSQEAGHKWNVSALPRKVDLRPDAENIEDQKATSSCSANAVCSAIEIMHKKSNNVKDFSRLFVYYNARNPELQDNRPVYDNGSRPDLCISSLGEEGVCEESVWPFTDNNVNQRPSSEAFELAKSNKSTEYSFINEYTTDAICAAVASGYPVVFTIRLRDRFFSLPGDLYSHPEQYDGSSDGYRGQHALHCMLIIGYDLDKKIFIVENSWSSSWGDGGFCGISFAEMEKSSYDYLVIRDFNSIRYDIPLEFYDSKDPKTRALLSRRNVKTKVDNKASETGKSKKKNVIVPILIGVAVIAAAILLI